MSKEVSAPKVFAREMEQTEANQWARHYQLWAGHVRIGLSVHGSTDQEWDWSVACKPQTCRSQEDAIKQIEARVLELVAGLGPLVGWAPLEKP